MKKIIIIDGGPRKNMNTAKLLQRFAEGAKSADSDMEVKTVRLYDLDYKGCMSCMACKLKGKASNICRFKDALTPVLDKYSDPETRSEINKILQYPEDSAGSLMTTEFIRLRRGTTVAGAFDVIRQKGDDSETINVSYVTDEARHLIGYVSTKALPCAPLSLVEPHSSWS